SALEGHAFLWAIGLNTFGTVFRVGGSLYAIARRRRVWTTVWIGGGALVVALATGLSRTGTYSLVYAGELIGITLMFYGFTWEWETQTAPARTTARGGRGSRNRPRPEPRRSGRGPASAGPKTLQQSVAREG